MLLLKLFVIIQCISQVITDLQVNVTKEECGRTVDIAEEYSLILDYDGGDLGQDGDEHCVITVQNKNSDKMMCIKTNSTRTRQCSSVFNYHIGNTSPGPNTIGYTCHDFYMHPLCSRRTPAFAAFQSPNGFYVARVNVEIYLENHTYFTTTTSPSLLTESEQSGIIIGLTVGGVSVVILLAVCARCNRRKSTSDDQLEQGYNVHYQDGNQSSPQQVVSTISQQYSPNTNGQEESINQTSAEFDGYHVYPTADITITGYSGRTTSQKGRINNAFSQAGEDGMSDPPPPYPGC